MAWEAKTISRKIVLELIGKTESIVWDDDGQEAVQEDQDDQHVQHVQHEEQQDGCDIEDNFAKDKVTHTQFNNKLSFNRLAETI